VTAIDHDDGRNLTDISIDRGHALAEPVPEEAEQQRFWNEWNANNRGAGYDPSIDAPTKRRRDAVLEWGRKLGLTKVRVLDLGCATGWLTHQLTEFGEVVGTDIADASIREARQRYPAIRFECEDFSNSSWANGEFDLVVSLETLSHVADQRAFIKRISDVLKPGGYLVLTTQNRIVFERRAAVISVAPGMIRKWLSPGELRRLLQPDFTVRRLTTFLPDGQLGFLRLVNSPLLNRLVGRLVAPQSVQRMKERFGLGQTIAVLAQRR
jgi:2-polyprenyl-3-methyl-5-hydroxy-6-metoxy-1,4-benzoquinol methylase